MPIYTNDTFRNTGIFQNKKKKKQRTKKIPRVEVKRVKKKRQNGRFIERWFHAVTDDTRKEKARKPVSPYGPGPVLEVFEERRRPMTACNNIENQNPDLENRFTLGKQFYDLERAACRGENIYVYMYTYIIYIYTYTYTREREKNRKGRRRRRKKRRRKMERFDKSFVSTGHHARMGRVYSWRFTKEGEKRGEMKEENRRERGKMKEGN